MFRSSDPWSAADPQQGGGPPIPEAIAVGAERVRSELAGEPELRADLSVAVAGVYVNLGLPGSARPLLEEALEIRREIHGPDSEPAAAAARQLARVLTLEGNGEAPMRSLRLRSPIIFRSTIPL